MLQQWERKRWTVYHLKDYGLLSTGAMSYTVGPAGDFNVGVSGSSARPNRLEFAYLRQLVTSPNNQIDYPLRILQSYEDYSRIALKSLVSFPGAAFLDTAWPLATLHVYPVAQAAIYEIHIGLREQLPTSFATLATEIVLPFEYYCAIIYNLALRLRHKYGIGSYPGDQLPEQAKVALAVVKGSNAQIAALRMPTPLTRPGIYNIFSDQSY